MDGNAAMQVNLLVKPEDTWLGRSCIFFLDLMVVADFYRFLACQETISSKFKGGLLECNFDKELLKMFQEVSKRL